VTASALDISRIRAITLDLDDTLWPIWPTIARAEAVLLDWLAEHAPATRALHASTAALRALRDRVQQLRPELSCDLGALRRESIRMALQSGRPAPTGRACLRGLFGRTPARGSVR
jgi:putative hydrolase of the HAD superfamily